MAFESFNETQWVHVLDSSSSNDVPLISTLKTSQAFELTSTFLTMFFRGISQSPNIDIWIEIYTNTDKTNMYGQSEVVSLNDLTLGTDRLIRFRLDYNDIQISDSNTQDAPYYFHINHAGYTRNGDTSYLAITKNAGQGLKLVGGSAPGIYTTNNMNDAASLEYIGKSI